MSHFTNYANYTAGTADSVVHYYYDYLNRLVRKTVGNETSGVETVNDSTVFVYDGNQVLLQFDHAGSGDAAATDLSHCYLWNPQVVNQLFADQEAMFST